MGQEEEFSPPSSNLYSFLQKHTYLISMAIALKSIEQLLSKIRHPEGLQNHFSAFQKQYKFNFPNTNFEVLKTKVAEINHKHKQQSQSNSEPSHLLTFDREALIILHWAIAVICYISQVSLNQMDSRHFQQLIQIFPHASQTELQYQTLCLANNSEQNNREWTEKQELLLKEVMQEVRDSNSRKTWKETSYKIYVGSQQRSFRSEAEVKKKWKKEQQWSCEADLKLLKAVREEIEFSSIATRVFGGKKTEKTLQRRFKLIMKRTRQHKNIPTKRTQLQKQIQRLEAKIKQRKQSDPQGQIQIEGTQQLQEMGSRSSISDAESSPSFFCQGGEVKALPEESVQEQWSHCLFERDQRAEKVMRQSANRMLLMEDSPFFSNLQNALIDLNGSYFIEEPCSLWSI